jgi:hypothetical protein
MAVGLRIKGREATDIGRNMDYGQRSGIATKDVSSLCYGSEKLPWVYEYCVATPPLSLNDKPFGGVLKLLEPVNPYQLLPVL